MKGLATLSSDRLVYVFSLGEEAAEGFMNLKPFEMKQLLYHILSGNEISFKRGLSFNCLYTAQRTQCMMTFM